MDLRCIPIIFTFTMHLQKNNTSQLLGCNVVHTSMNTMTHATSIMKTRLFQYIENWKFQIKKNSDSFHITAQNIDCGYSLEPPRRGGSNEYPQSMFLSRNKKNNVYPSKPQFYYIKWGLRGSKLHRRVFVMTWSLNTVKINHVSL